MPILAQGAPDFSKPTPMWRGGLYVTVLPPNDQVQQRRPPRDPSWREEPKWRGKKGKMGMQIFPGKLRPHFFLAIGKWVG
jgi:hypothetical protein